MPITAECTPDRSHYCKRYSVGKADVWQVKISPKNLLRFILVPINNQSLKS